MNEPTITCTKCKAQIKLTESLAAPFLESARQQYEQKISQIEDEVIKREKAISVQQTILDKSQKELDKRVDLQVAEKLKSERQAIATIEKDKAREDFAAQITKIQQEKAHADKLLKDRDTKLAEAQKNEFQLRKDRQSLQEEKEQFELQMQRAIDAERTKIRAIALKDADDQSRLKIAQKDKTISDLQKVAEKLKSEHHTISAIEKEKAREDFAAQITKIQQEKAHADKLLKDRDTKLAEAQKNELQLRKDRQTLQEEKEQFELQMQRAIDAERTKIRAIALKDADDQSRLKIAEKDKTISDLHIKLQDALQKAKQGSQQLQGEVQELELESLLQAKFPSDIIDPVPKGEHGGDALHRVISPLGQHCGSILWESKRTKNWSDGWLSKLREDQRMAKADIAIIMSQALPKNVEIFDFIDGVWIVEPRCFIPVAVALRQSLIELSLARQAKDGQQTKTEMVYQYLTGPRFRHRVEAIVEKFADMQADLDKERKMMTRLWAKRHEQIRCVIESTAGMYGDLQGIAGKTLQEIEGLDIKLIGSEEEVVNCNCDEILQKLALKINEIEFSVRTTNCLAIANIDTIGELVVMPETELLRSPNFGKKSLFEIEQKLDELGLSLGMDLTKYGISRNTIKKVIQNYLQEKTESVEV